MKLRLLRLLKLLALLAGRAVVVVLLVDERVLLVRDAGDVSSCFAVVVVAGPVAPTCAREVASMASMAEMSRQWRVNWTLIMAHWQRRQPTQMRIAPTIAAAVIRPA